MLMKNTKGCHSPNTTGKKWPITAITKYTSRFLSAGATVRTFKMLMLRDLFFCGWCDLDPNLPESIESVFCCHTPKYTFC